MMAVTNSLSTDIHHLPRGLQTVKIQFIPQMVSTLRRDLVFWENQSEGEKKSILKDSNK